MKLLVICILVASATTVQAESRAEKRLRMDEKRLRIANEIMKLIEESQQLNGEINSMLETMGDDMDMIIEMGLTQEYADLIANCDNDPLWRWLKAYNKKFKKIEQISKKNMDKMRRYSEGRTPLALLNKWKRYAIRGLKIQQKRHAVVIQLERKCGVINKL